MKILFIFTGGTISTTLTNSVMSVDPDKPYKLLDSYNNKFGIDFEYDCVAPYLELSENNTGVQLEILCSCVKENLTKEYDGIIITHGTDTLQYSASALAYCVGNSCNPVCLVSASYPLEDEKTNALYNLHGAVCIIKNKLGHGVFVPFKNSKAFVKVHRGTRLLPSNPFSDEVISVGGCEYGYFDNSFNFVKNSLFFEKGDAIPPLSPTFHSTSPVLFLHAHVGMIYPELSQKVKYVLISSYHSGTLDTKSEEAKSFYEKAKMLNIKVFVSGVMSENIYESATLFNTLSVTPLPLSPIAAYIKLWLIATSNGDEKQLTESLGGDAQ